MQQVKTRNLSVAKYFEVIQQEYLIAQFRKKIYYSPKDKRYYERVMGHKKEKIDNIANRNHLDSIFTSKAKETEIRRSVFDLAGRPIFEMTDTDKKNYYAVGNEFSYQGKIWILDAVRQDGLLTLYCAHDERYENVLPDEVIRIL